MIVAFCFLMMLVFFLLRFPIYISMLIPSLFYFLLTDTSILQVPQMMIGAVQQTSILAIPFFIMSGVCMNYTGITKRMMKFAEILTGHMPGGLAQVNVVLSTLMGGLSGSNLADAAMEAKILVPQMTARGYTKGFSAAITAASALITPIIPPGIALITYGFVANVSVGRLFMAGILPGLLMCLMLMVMVHLLSKKRGYRPIRQHHATAGEVVSGGKTAILALILPVVIIGGIRIGVFTATEAGAVAVMYSLALGVLVYHEMKFKHFQLAVRDTVLQTANIMLIFATARCFAYFVSNERIPDLIAGFLMQFISEPWQFLLMINVVLLVMGMFLEAGALTILIIPLTMPIVHQLGIDPVHFGLVFILNTAIGTVTPPVGTVMFTTCQICDVKMEEFVRECLPFYVALLICLLLLTFLPQLSLFLPNLVYGPAV